MTSVIGVEECSSNSTLFGSTIIRSRTPQNRISSQKFFKDGNVGEKKRKLECKPKIEWTKAEKIFQDESLATTGKVIVGKNIPLERVLKFTEKDGSKKAALWRKYRFRYDPTTKEVYFYKRPTSVHEIISPFLITSMDRQFQNDEMMGRGSTRTLLRDNNGNVINSKEPDCSFSPTDAPFGNNDADGKNNNCPTVWFEFGFSEEINDLHDDICKVLEQSQVTIGCWISLWPRVYSNDTFQAVIALYDKRVSSSKPYDVVSFGTKTLSKVSKKSIKSATKYHGISGCVEGSAKSEQCLQNSGFNTVYIETVSMFNGSGMAVPQGVPNYWEINLHALQTRIEKIVF